MEALREGPASPSPGVQAPWPEFGAVEEQVFFVKKVVPTWEEEGVGVAEGGGGGAMECAGAAVACEAVEVEDLFANPIAEGANLEFRVSRVTEGGGGGGEEAMEVDGTVFERLAKSEIVMEEREEEEEEVVEEEVVESDVKVEVSEGEGKLMQSLSEEVKVMGESDAAVAMNRLEMQSKLVNSHVEELQRIVSLQCRLTGANPLAQELVGIFFRVTSLVSSVW